MGIEGNQEGLSALHPSPELADDTQTQLFYEDDVLQNLSGQIAQISISHDRGYATAVCLAAQGPLEGDVGGELAARNL
jgi:phosphopantetheinyl transferase (holo-ACP synthase)